MPNLATHYLCGLEAVKNIENSGCRELIQRHQNVFNLGVQGPDILFYYEVWPWSKKSIEPNIGRTMHSSKVNMVFRALVDYILRQKGHVRDILSVYLMGFVSHNCMDGLGHPYIFYRSGFNTPEANNENLFVYYHRKFEVTIDVLLCKRFLDKQVHQINCAELLEVNKVELGLIGEMYESAVNSVFNANIHKKKVKRAVKEMLLVEKLLRDPCGVKKKVLEFIDRLIYRFPLYSSLIYPLQVTDGLDYLNISGSEWCMPFDSTIKSTKSFMDLFNEACKKTQVFCDLLYSGIFLDSSGLPRTLELLGNNSYTTGIDCDTPAVFKYSDIIFR
ncbi:hypothetical protein CLHUN_32120 [Ruminiclostridium hungatei]|uniref:Phospholipase C/D domain-containing protein n=1 Tax=Ruminiclostridium hungatei TaxID=48256 RepID=A0A1V4SG95_RUMHU|nr:zinc dependent phospholipase C family protein [Ruminiclostridium hungatei]OPX42888.1 hypothetical protein CLHUN_32120 [Ruminiclostridium hungatei]